MKSIIITGITGQDGSHMADFLLKDPNNFVYGAHRHLSVENHDNIKHLKDHPRFQKIELDLTDVESINSAFKQYRPNYFINFAANSFVGNSWKMPINHMQTNCMGVLSCLEAIRNFSTHTRFYNAGSSEQFGDVIQTPQGIDHPFRPRSPYGASKCAAHHLVKVYRESYGIFAVQGILFNHEGVRRGGDFVTRKITKGVASIRKDLAAGKPFLPMELGNLDSKRDWSDAEDFVEGIWLMLNQDAPVDYVLSSNETHSVREFVELAFGYAGVEGKWSGNGSSEIFLENNSNRILVQINPKFYRPAEVGILWGDSNPAREELQWEPKTSFSNLVKKMVDNDLKL